MNEKLVVYSFSVSDPSDAVALGDLACYFMVPFGATLVYASAAPWDDDTDATMDLNDDGVAIITALTADDKDVPGEWISTHAGGTQTPIAIAAGSEMTLDFNDAAAANRFDCVFHFLAGETWG
jgi:hypothetical protein